MPLFTLELKSLRAFTLLWNGALLALAGLYVSIYPTFAREADQMQAVFQAMPMVVRKGIGFDPDLLFSFLGFFTNVAHFLLLAAAIMAAVLGFTVFPREHRTKTTDFLLTKPVCRSSLFAQKFFAGLVIIVLTNMVFGGGVYILAQVFHAGSIDMAIFGRIILAFGIVQLWFFVIAGLLAVLFQTKRSPSGPGLAIAAGLFLVGMVGSMIDPTATRWISPFKYIDLAYILKHSAYEMRFVWYACVWIIVAMLLAATIWIRRDVRAET